MKPFHLFLLSLALPAVAVAAITPQDYRSGIELLPEAGHPVIELALPDAIYAGVRHADLGDVAIFNADGTPVPYALCAPQQPAAAVVDVPLPVFPLQAAKAAAAEGTRIEVQGNAAANVEIRPATPPDAGQAPAATTEVSAYVIDARALQQPLKALRLRWHTADGASELHLRIEDSADLDQWRVLVPQTTLVQAGSSEQGLKRGRVILPPGSGAYLRVSRNDPGPAPILDEVIAETAVAVPADALRWFSPSALPAQAGQGITYGTARLAPVTTARIALPAANMTLRIALQSRAGDSDAWRGVWNGTVYSVGSGADERHSEDPAFNADSDRYWRIQVLQGAESLGAGTPGLSLGYRPAQLRFLAQGSGPFLLAAGSGGALVTASPGCEGLLQGLPREQLQAMIGSASLGALKTLGGDAALTPAPKPTPLRQLVLWAVLLLGAAAVIAMALGLMRNLRRQP